MQESWLEIEPAFFIAHKMNVKYGFIIDSKDL